MPDDEIAIRPWTENRALRRVTIRSLRSHQPRARALRE
jgi:hypothetical protein